MVTRKDPTSAWSGRLPRSAVARERQAGASGTVGARPGGRASEARSALLFLTPGLALVLLTFVYPVYRLVRLSLEQSLADLTLFVGIDNYRLVLTDPVFRTGVRNNLLLMACVPAMVAVALVFAVLLFEQRRSSPFYRFVLFAPYVVSIPVSGIAFSAMLTKNGALNSLLGGIGLDALKHDWLGNPRLALVSVGAVIVWRESALGIVLFFARMLSLAPELLDAATIDGASRWRAHRDVTLPQLRGVTGLFIITSVITLAVWTFSYVFVMTNGGPGNATLTADLYVYQTAFATSQMNLAAAASTLILLATILALVGIVLARKAAPRGG